MAELERCAELGLKTVALSAFPNGSPYATPEDDRFWEKALELRMPLAAHTHFGAPYPPFVTGATPQAQAGGALGGVLCTRQAFQRPLYTIAQLIFAGVFERFPELQFYFAETNASWLPNALEQIDQNYDLYAHTLPVTLSKAPSEYVVDHFFFCFIQDVAATRMLDLLPTDNLIWGSDFPHSVTSFPRSQEWISANLGGVDADLRRRLVAGNAARYFGLDLDAEITATPEPALA